MRIPDWMFKTAWIALIISIVCVIIIGIDQLVQGYLFDWFLQKGVYE